MNLKDPLGGISAEQARKVSDRVSTLQLCTELSPHEALFFGLGRWGLHDNA